MVQFGFVIVWGCNRFQDGRGCSGQIGSRVGCVVGGLCVGILFQRRKFQFNERDIKDAWFLQVGQGNLLGGFKGGCFCIGSAVASFLHMLWTPQFGLVCQGGMVSFFSRPYHLIYL